MEHNYNQDESSNNQICLDAFQSEYNDVMKKLDYFLCESQKCDTQLDVLLQYFTEIKQEINIKLELIQKQIKDGIRNLKELRASEIEKLNNNNQTYSFASLQKTLNQIKEEQGNQANTILRNIYKIEIQANEQYQDLLKYLQTKIRQPPVLVKIQENKNLADLQQAVQQELLKDDISLFYMTSKKRAFMCKSIALSKDEKYILTNQVGRIIIWKLEKDDQIVCQQESEGHSLYVYSMVFGFRSNWFATGGMDKKILIWQEKSQENWLTVQTLENDSQVKIIALTNDDTQMIAGLEKSIKIFSKSEENSEWKSKQIFKIDGFSTEIRNMSFSPSYNLMVSQQGKETVIWQNTTTCWVQQTKLPGKFFGVSFLDETHLITQNEKGELIVFGRNSKNEFEIESELQLKEKLGRSDEFQLTSKLNLALCNKEKELLIVLQKSNDELVKHQSIKGRILNAEISKNCKFLLLQTDEQVEIWKRD